MEIFIARDKQQTGPFSEEQIRGMLSAGMISSTDLAWHDQLAGWLPLDQILNVATSNPPPPPQPPPFNPGGESMGGQTNFTGASVSDLIYPTATPRSVGWMTFWGFMWPGLGQLLCGQTQKGAVLMIVSFFLNLIFLVTLIVPLAICIASAVDTHQVARSLASGKPVRKWAFFPG
jgi:hypothetical protein